MNKLLLLGNIKSSEVWAFFDTMEELIDYAINAKINVVYILKNNIFEEVDIPNILKPPSKNGN